MNEQVKTPEGYYSESGIVSEITSILTKHSLDVANAIKVLNDVKNNIQLSPVVEVAMPKMQPLLYKNYEENDFIKANYL